MNLDLKPNMVWESGVGVVVYVITRRVSGQVWRNRN